jgi:hypothetical protein
MSLVLGDEIPIAAPQAELAGGKGKKAPKPKPLSKAEEIKQKNSVGRIKQSIDDALSTFKTDFSAVTSISLTASMNSDIVEIKGLGLLYACAWLDHHIAVFNTEEHYAKVFDVIATAQKFINICERPDMMCISKITGEMIRMSPMLIEDLARWVTRLRARFVKNGVCVFNWENIQKYAPQIFIQSEYQKALPQQYVKLKSHQKQIVDAVRNNIVNGAWIVYDAMIGSGKTTGQIGVAALISHLRISNPALYGKLRFLSVCNSEAVRLDVAQKCYNAVTTFPSNKLHFAISYITRDSQRKPKAKIVKNNACEKDSDIITVIASPSVAKMIIEENDKLDDDDDNKYQYILFVDEPTMGADNRQSRSLYDNVAINHVSPYITINSSATFPNVGMLTNITNDFFERHRRATQVRVYSDEISIGCDIRTLSGEMVVPHLGATNRAQLREIISCVSMCSFLGKTYTPSVVNSIYQRMLTEHISVPSIPTLFEDVNNLDINRVRETAIMLLRILADQTDDVIQRVCFTTISDEDEEEDEDLLQSASFSFSANDNADDVATAPLDYSKLGTEQAYRLQGQTLIATDNPERFVLDNFGTLIDQVYAHQTHKVVSGGDIATSVYKSTGDAMRKYNAELDDWRKKEASIDKNATSVEDKRFKMEEHDRNKPVFPFPDWAHVNSEHHISKYARSHRDTILHNIVRGKLNVPHLSDKILNVDDRILTALFCGVAIYSTETVRCRFYLDVVLQLASAGALAYVVADSTICFGTNYPFYNVIITQEFSALHSMLVIFQVMGRAGRPGKSPKALIIVPDIVATRIINFVTTSSEADSEARNMEDVFLQQKHEIELEEERQIAARIAAATAPETHVSQLTVIRGRTAVVEQEAMQVIEQVIVPISKVPEGNLKYAPTQTSQTPKPIEQRRPLKSGDWRNTKSSADSSNEWKRASVPQERPPERKDTKPNTSGGGKYVPPAMRGNVDQQEKAPRHKQYSDSKFSDKKPSSSSGWKKDK